jgi:hypothetical protein
MGPRFNSSGAQPLPGLCYWPQELGTGTSRRQLEGRGQQTGELAADLYAAWLHAVHLRVGLCYWPQELGTSTSRRQLEGRGQQSGETSITSTALFVQRLKAVLLKPQTSVAAAVMHAHPGSLCIL